MASTLYEAILKDFETFFKCPLNPDKNNSCLIKMANGVHIQIEEERHGQILIASKLGVIQGRFQDNVLREALRANEFYLPSTGIFGFSAKSNNLTLYLYVDPRHINPDRINTFLPPFIAKAKVWMDALQQGNIPALEEIAQTTTKSSPFGLK